MTSLTFETMSLRQALSNFLNTPFRDGLTGADTPVGNFKFGVYAFFDYDGEPIYVGQTNEKIRSRVRRHLTNQRTDAVAMSVLDPFEVYEIELWPLPQYQDLPTASPAASQHLNWLETTVFNNLLRQSTFSAVLNEKDPPAIPAGTFAMPRSIKGRIVTDAVLNLRGHPDTRIARRSNTIAALAKVISERQVKQGLRRTLLTQAKRLAWLAERRLTELTGTGEESDEAD